MVCILASPCMVYRSRLSSPHSGAGVGGLVLAVVLSRSPNISVDIYEAASALKEVGAGIGMWPRTWKIIKKLGLDAELGKKAIIHPEGIPSQCF